jgi:hypothetical protein
MVLAGYLAGATSPVKTLSELFYGHCVLSPGGHLDLPPTLGERAAYVVEGAVDIGESTVNSGEWRSFRTALSARSPHMRRRASWYWAVRRWMALAPLVELRIGQQGSHRKGEDRLGCRTLSSHSGR